MAIGQVWYSLSVHAIILLSIGLNLWLVLKKSFIDPSFTLQAHGYTVLSFGFCLLVYLVLRVLEANLETNRREIRMLAGHLSHLTGGLAVLSLVFLLSPFTAACLFPFWAVWLSAIVSVTLAKLMRHRSSVADVPV